MPEERVGAWPHVGILGLGLMGASLGMALRRAKLVSAGGLAGYDVDPTVAQRAAERGAVDRAATSAEDVVFGAQLVVLAAPVLAIHDLLSLIAPHLAPEAVLMDLGSTKVAVGRWARETLPDPTRFIPTHPMTGSEHAGPDAADPELYTGCVWCLTPDESASRTAVQRVRATIESLGARTLVVSAQEHDAAVATVSHLPLVAAAALALAAGDAPSWPLARRLAAGGFRDTTRVASGDPRMARDICLTNAEPVLAALDTYMSRLEALRAAVAAGDPAIETLFGAAKSLRDGWIEEQR